MINPTKEDIGKPVIYQSSCGETENGVITSFNDHYVFVRYENQHISTPGQATSREDLQYSR